jgi:hypothetical protein
VSVRLRHPTLRGVTFTVVHYRRYTVPMACGVCGSIHTHKTYHLRLDSQGEVVVSDTVAERLAELEGLPLRNMGVEAHPQPQVLAMPVGAQNGQSLRQPTQTFVPAALREAVEEALKGV